MSSTSPRPPMAVAPWAEVAPTQTFQGPWPAMTFFKVRPASQSRGATRVGCAPDVARRIHMGSAASGGDSLRQGL